MLLLLACSGPNDDPTAYPHGLGMVIERADAWDRPKERIEGPIPERCREVIAWGAL